MEAIDSAVEHGHFNPVKVVSTFDAANLPHLIEL